MPCACRAALLRPTAGSPTHLERGPQLVHALCHLGLRVCLQDRRLRGAHLRLAAGAGGVLSGSPPRALWPQLVASLSTQGPHKGPGWYAWAGSWQPACAQPAAAAHLAAPQLRPQLGPSQLSWVCRQDARPRPVLADNVCGATGGGRPRLPCAAGTPARPSPPPRSSRRLAGAAPAAARLAGCCHALGRVRCKLSLPACLPPCPACSHSATMGDSVISSSPSTSTGTCWFRGFRCRQEHQAVGRVQPPVQPAISQTAGQLQRAGARWPQRLQRRQPRACEGWQRPSGGGPARLGVGGRVRHHLAVQLHKLGGPVEGAVVLFC